jgi:26S proteasome regulatory subunit N12
MGVENDVEKLLKEFKTLFNQNNPDVSKCKPLLSKMKLAMIQFNLIPPFAADEKVAKKQLLLAREVLELATLLSLADKDEEAFERYINQVKPFYNDYSHLLSDSERKWPILGLNLLFLLSENRIAEFHTELELIPRADQSNLYITYPTELEKRLMEGNYNKVLAARTASPLPFFQFFMDKLVTTVRCKLADCTEKAYKTFPLSQLATLLLLPDDKALKEFCQEREWKQEGGEILFAEGTQATKSSVPTFRLITETLQYATELERIV